ncbi:transposase [Aeromonas veronii]|nr:transposase [Aeromonas veronii]
MFFTVNELIGLPGIPGTVQGARWTLNKRAGDNPDLRRRRDGTKAFEYHLDCLPTEAQAAIRERHYQALMEQNAAAEPAAVPTTTATNTAVKPRQKLDLLRQCPALLEKEINSLTEVQRKIADARALLAQNVLALCNAGASRIAAVSQIVRGSREGTLPLPLMEAAALANARKGTRVGIGKSSLQEWVSIYLATANSAERLNMLAPGHHKERTPEQIGWLPRFLAHWRDLNGPSMQAAYNEFENEWMQDYADQPGMQAAIPSYSAVRRAMNKLPRREKARGRVSGSAARALETYVKRDWSVMPVNGCWVSDGKSLNMKVSHPIHGQPFTPELTMVIDGRSRVVVGWSLALSENMIAVADAYRHAMSQFGKPLFTYSDNGGGEKNKALDADIVGIFPRLGITHLTGIPGNPQARGIIERLNAVIPRAVAIKFPTYNGHGADQENVRITSRAINSAVNALSKGKELNPVQRKAIAKLPSWHQLLDVIKEEVDKYNHHHRHSELPKVSGKHMTPMEAYRAALEEDGTEIDFLTEIELRNAFMPEEIRTADRGWLPLFNNEYFSDALMMVDGEKVRVAYDIHDPSFVIVRKMDGTYVCNAIWNGNKRAAIAEPRVQQALAKRTQARLKLNDKKREEIEAEGRGLLSAPSQPDFNLGMLLQGEYQEIEQHEYHFLEVDREEAKKNGTHDE